MLDKVTDTSLEAFKEVKKDIGKRQLEVYNAIKELGHGTNTMISKWLNLPINCVTPRVKELRDKKLVGASIVDICPITKRRAIYWKCVKEPVYTFGFNDYLVEKQ